MADGRKNEEIKVIKNPLLRQNLLLEEISGISFVVPAVSEKLEAVDNGSSQGLEVSQIGAKREGSDGKPQETQSFTDIPLDVPESTEESIPPPSSSIPEKQEGSSFGFRSIIPSFVPLLVPQSFKNSSPNVLQDAPTPVECLQTSKRVSTPETVVPQLLPPPSSEKASPLPASLNSIKKDVFHPGPSPTPSASSAASFTGTPPPLAAGPPPLASNINRNANLNPYALKRIQLSSGSLNSASSKSHTNESPFFMPSPVTSLGSTLPSQSSNSYMIPSFPVSNILPDSSLSNIPPASSLTNTSPASSLSNISSVSTITSLASTTPAPSLMNIIPASSNPSLTNAPPGSSLSNISSVSTITSLASTSAPPLMNIIPASSIPSLTNAPPASSLPNVSSVSTITSLANTTTAPSLMNTIPASSIPSLVNAPPASSLSNISSVSTITSVANTTTAPSLMNTIPASSIPSLANAPPASSLTNISSITSLMSTPPAPSLMNIIPASSIPSLSNISSSLTNMPPVSSIPSLTSASLPSSLTNMLPVSSVPSLNNPSFAPPHTNIPPSSNIVAPSGTPLPNMPPALSNSFPSNIPLPYPLNSFGIITPPTSNLPCAPPLPNLPCAPPLPNLPCAPPLPNLPCAPPLPKLPCAPPLPKLPCAPPLSNLPCAPPLPNLPCAPPLPNLPCAPPLPNLPCAPPLLNLPPASSISFFSNMPSASSIPPSNISPIASNPLASAMSSIPSNSSIGNISSIPLISKSSTSLINSNNSDTEIPLQTGKDSSSNTSDTNKQTTIFPDNNLAHKDSGSVIYSKSNSLNIYKSEGSQVQNVEKMSVYHLPVSKQSSNEYSDKSAPQPSDTNNIFSNQVSPQSGLLSESVPLPLPNSILPPPMANINKSGSINPYTLKKDHHSSPYASKERITSSPLNTSTASLFNQSSSSFNMLSGPGVGTSAQTSPTNESDNVLDSNNQNVQFPLVKNFASAISNFISPNKQTNDSIIENKSSTAILDPYNGLSAINNNYNQPAIPIPSAQHESLQPQPVPNIADQNIPLPNNFPLNFNASHVYNNGFCFIPSNGITDNTVCVSAITTALSSVAPSSGIPSTPSSQMDASFSSTHLASQVSQFPDNNQLQTFSNVPSPQSQQTVAFNSNCFNNNVTDNQVQNTNYLSNINSYRNNSVTSTSSNIEAKNNNSQPQNLSGPETTLNSDQITSRAEIFSHKEEPKNVALEDTSVNKANFPGNVPVIQPIPTFNYFSSSQGTNLTQPDKNTSFQTKQIPALPTSSFFKPIESPNVSTSAFPTPNPPPLSQGYQNIAYTNPLPPAPPKISFPPPNIKIHPKIATKTPPKSEPENSEAKSGDKLDFEELDQIPLEGSAVPLYRADYLCQKKKTESSGEVGNSYRLSGSLKKPTYAPVPELGLTGRKSYPEPSRSNSLSSQEEMAAIEAQSTRISPPQGKTSPSTSTTLDTYYSNLLAAPSYRPPYQHWFFKSGQHKKSPWTPFSMADSLNLEQIYTSDDVGEDTKVPTDGGRYDVEIIRRKRTSVYWEEPSGEVRRCSWFVKSVTDSRYTPYDENIAALLEEEYKKGCESNEWNRRIELADGEVIILHSPTAMAHHVRSSSPDAWGSQPTLQQKPRVVKRGVDDFNIAKGEPKQVDHLLLMVHGVGKACDLRFRSLVEVVDDFRSIAQQLVGSHFHSGVENGNVGRVEILPVEWHGALHTEAINDRLSAITLPSIPRAREFTNETLLDILFYTSPVFAETIVQAVGEELNRVFTLYKARNPGFRGQVSLGGHSLGSLILFDILCHQKVQRAYLSTQSSLHSEDDEAMDELGCLQKTKAKLNRRMSYLTIGPGTGQPYTTYPQLMFQPRNFFALGSPIGMFVTVRGLEALGEDFKFPTCPSFFNIFHPNDPVAYRIEALIKPEMATIPAVLIPHHKGRKRMHLELKETMAHVTAALKQKLVDSMKNTWNAVYHLTLFNKKDNSLQGEVNQVIEDEVMRDLDSDPPLSVIGEEGAGTDVKVGKLNGGRRVDYVLQEAPLETFNQYISAIRSHLVYWESEDTTLMILKEIYGGMGISPDTQVPQPILPFDLTAEADSYSDYTYSIGALPTQFIRK